MTPMPDATVRATPPFRTRCRMDGAGVSDGLLAKETMDLLRTLGESDARSASLSLEDKIRCATHPDEFVRWLFLGRDRFDLGNPSTWARHARRPKGGATDLRLFQVHTALREADAEGCVWTPVLDRLAYSAYRHWWVHDSGARTDAMSASLRARLDGLAPWIAAQTTTAALAPLGEFETPEVRQVVARYATCLDVPFLRTQVGTADDGVTRGTLQRLGENPALSGAARAWVGHVVLEQFLTTQHGWGTRDTLFATLQRFSAHPAGFTPAMRRTVRRTVTQTAERFQQPSRERGVSALLLDRSASADELATALAAIPPTTKQRAYYWLHPRTPDATRHGLLTGAGSAHDTAREILTLGATPAQIEEIVTTRSDDTPLLVEIASGTFDASATWRRLAQETKSTKVKLALAQNPAAVQDVATRTALLRTSVPEVLAALLPVAPEGEVRRIVRAVAGKDPEEALNLIQHLPKARRRLLRQSDLIGVFAGVSGEGTVRLLQEIAVRDDAQAASAGGARRRP